MSRSTQPPLFPTLTSKTIVNVASVKHLSPFRYPGGKTWLVPRVREWLATLPGAAQKVHRALLRRRHREPDGRRGRIS